MSKIALRICRNEWLEFLKSKLSEFTSRAYFVGGCVRDFLLGRECDDFDIEIYDVSPERFTDLMQEIGANGVGKSFFVYKFHEFDLALPRVESKSGVGHKGFDVALCDDEKIASKRRDFTINSLMVNIFSGEMLDFWGGRRDLDNKILRIVNEKTFKDDSLRVLRGVQFAARFALKIDTQSLKIMRDIDIGDLSKERIHLELEKLFRADFQDFGIRALSLLGLDFRLFGVNLDEKFGLKVASHFALTRQKETFLYDLIHKFGLDPKKLIANLKLSSDYKRLISEPFIRKVCAKNLLKIALKMPLKSWLGLNSQRRVKLAKKLGFYDSKITFNIDDSGFKELSLHTKLSRIQSQQEAVIERILKEKM